MSTLKFFIYSHWKRSGPEQKISGFTLIELLVAMILAALVITPLLGFLVDLMGADRREQAQATSQQEIQAAMDYINRDLQQAIYIYDRAGLDTIPNGVPGARSIRQQLQPIVANGQPVLVFWKREFRPQAIQAGTSTQRDDSFSYALVAYYLIPNTDGSNPTWSRTARIARLQLRDGVPAANGTNCPGVTTPAGTPQKRFAIGSDGKPICPDPGFSSFLDAVGSTTIEKIRNWQMGTGTPDPPQVLVDFIDQTQMAAGDPATLCPGFPAPVAPNPGPPVTVGTNPLVQSGVAGFYACVQSVNPSTQGSVAQIFLRGNARARLQNTPPTFQQGLEAQFPTASMRVEGRSFLFTQ